VILETPAHAVAEPTVAKGAAELLDPRVLVRRHGLARQLSADPVGLLDDDHVLAHPGGGERRGETACAASQDDNVFFWRK